MNKRHSCILLFSFLLLFFIGFSCKKDTPSTPNGDNGYRLVSLKKTWHMPDHTYVELENFVYDGDRISHYEMIEDKYRHDVTEYSYQDNLAIAKTQFYEDSSLTQVDSTIFLSDNNTLKRISVWRNSDTLWILINDAEFYYNGNQEIAYYDTIDMRSMKNGVSIFENDHLVQYKLYYYEPFTDTWYIGYSQNFTYEGDKIKEQIVHNGFDLTKCIYHYSGQRINKIDVYIKHFTEYELTYQNEYTYDDLGNLVTDTRRNTYDQSLNYITEYQYETGNSNLRHISFGYYPYPGMWYPKP